MENPLHKERQSLNNASGRKQAPSPPPRKKSSGGNIEILKERADKEQQ